nr:unnamed protein product [Digitaria exilis]CAB3503972.1 unnamed protein product [Digitaria exilis]
MVADSSKGDRRSPTTTGDPDFVLPTEMQEQERRPEGHQPLLRRPAAAGHRQVAKHVDRRRVGQHVR